MVKSIVFPLSNWKTSIGMEMKEWSHHAFKLGELFHTKTSTLSTLSIRKWEKKYDVEREQT